MTILRLSVILVLNQECLYSVGAACGPVRPASCVVTGVGGAKMAALVWVTSVLRKAWRGVALRAGAGAGRSGQGCPFAREASSWGVSLDCV